jgi:hypothetical protein
MDVLRVLLWARAVEFLLRRGSMPPVASRHTERPPPRGHAPRIHQPLPRQVALPSRAPMTCCMAATIALQRLDSVSVHTGMDRVPDEVAACVKQCFKMKRLTSCDQYGGALLSYPRLGGRL